MESQFDIEDALNKITTLNQYLKLWINFRPCPHELELVVKEVDEYLEQQTPENLNKKIPDPATNINPCYLDEYDSDKVLNETINKL